MVSQSKWTDILEKYHPLILRGQGWKQRAGAPGMRQGNLSFKVSFTTTGQQSLEAEWAPLAGS